MNKKEIRGMVQAHHNQDIPKSFPSFRRTSYTEAFGLSVDVLKDVKILYYNELTNTCQIIGDIVVSLRNGKKVDDTRRVLHDVPLEMLKAGEQIIGKLPVNIQSVGSVEYIAANPVKVERKPWRGLPKKN